MEKTQKEELIRSAVRSAVFAVVFGLIISCSHNTNLVTPPTNVTGLRQLVSHITPTMIGFPANLKGGQPLLATFFQTAPQTSQIQQSFEGLSCGAFQPGSEVNFSHTASGFIPIQVLGDPFIEPGDPSAVEKMACGGVFAQVGGGTDISIPLPPAPPPTKPGTLTNPGTVIYTDGTLSTLIVTGLSKAGQQIRCSDTKTTAPVHDLDLVQPYFVIGTNSVVLAVGTNQLPFTCQLSIPAGDSAGSLAVNWVKM